MGENNKKIVCQDKDGIKEEFNIEELEFRPSVYGVLIENKKILLVKQWDGYDFPGGGINIDETIHQALTREFFEETGWTIKPIRVIWCETSFYITHSDNQPKNCPLIYFLVKKVREGKLKRDNLSEHEQQYAGEPKWIDLDKIEKIKFYNSVDSIKIIKEVVENTKD